MTNDKPVPQPDQSAVTRPEPTYAKVCDEHDEVLHADGTCPLCRDKDGKPFILDMQSYYLMPTYCRACAARDARDKLVLEIVATLDLCERGYENGCKGHAVMPCITCEYAERIRALAPRLNELIAEKEGKIE